MVAVALAFAVLELGGSATAVGLVLASGALTLVCSLIIGGVIADRGSRRAVMVSADLVRVASQGAMAALVITGAGEIWMLAMLAAITGAATGFFNPASTGLLPTLVAPEQLQQANGLRATAMASGEILGPLAAGALVALASAGWALAVDALTFAVSAAFLMSLHLPAALARKTASFLAEMKEGWDAFRSRRWVWSVVAFAAIGNIMWGAWSVLGPVVAQRDLGGGAAWGTILGAMGVGGLMGSLLATQASFRRPLVVFALTGAFLSLPLGLLAAPTSLPLIAIGALTAGSALMLGNSVWESTIQRHIPQDSLSRVSAYDWFGSFVFGPVGLAIWGPIAAGAGLGVALWIACVVQVVTMLALLAVPDVRHLRAFPDHVLSAPVPSGARRLT
jgi:MFS family permease